MKKLTVILASVCFIIGFTVPTLYCKLATIDSGYVVLIDNGAPVFEMEIESAFRFKNRIPFQTTTGSVVEWTGEYLYSTTPLCTNNPVVTK